MAKTLNFTKMTLTSSYIYKISLYLFIRKCP